MWYLASQVAAAIVKLFTKIPPPSEPARVILPLSKLILTTEKTLLIEPGSILRAPLKVTYCFLTYCILSVYLLHTYCLFFIIPTRLTSGSSPQTPSTSS